MSIFDEGKMTFRITAHARKRLVERSNYTLEESEQACLELISEGKLMLETEVFRYVRNGNFFFPCKKEQRNPLVYKVTTVLLYDEMVENRFQKIIDLYDKNIS